VGQQGFTKDIAMNWTSSSVGAAIGQLADAGWIDTSNALGRLRKQSQTTRIVLFLALFAATAWLDFIVDHDLSLFVLYLIPTLYSAWYLGSKWAYGGCLAGGTVWFIDDLPRWHSYHHTLIPYGNLAGRVAVLIIIVTIVSALKNALEDQYEAERRVTARDLDIASEVQRRLLPSQPPDYAGLEFGFAYRPARELGGDYYDFIPLSSERIAIAIGDVSGKGLPSALLMASLESLVRTNLALRDGNLDRFASELNQRIYEETTTERYVTFFLAVVDTSSLTLRFLNAGHNPPVFFRKWSLSAHRSTAEMLDSGGPPLGIFAATQYTSGQMLLQEGDVLVLYTDGVSEAVNAGQEEFGEERLRDVVRASLSLSAAEICQNVLDRLDAFTSGSLQWDDITLVVVRVKSEFTDSLQKTPETRLVTVPGLYR
jgi:serine phosphatase RsbU (regulator of sigma subunit)